MSRSWVAERLCRLKFAHSYVSISIIMIASTLTRRRDSKLCTIHSSRLEIVSMISTCNTVSVNSSMLMYMCFPSLQRMKKCVRLASSRLVQRNCLSLSYLSRTSVSKRKRLSMRHSKDSRSKSARFSSKCECGNHSTTLYNGTINKSK